MKTISYYLTIICILLFAITAANAQTEALEKGLNAITKESSQAQLEFLSSDWMEGRATGEKGEFIAGDYLASMLQFLGVNPAGDKEWTQPNRKQRWSGIRSEEYTSYFQNIYMTRFKDNSSELSISFDKSDVEYTFNENTHYSVSDYPVNIKASADLVFVGYGFVDEKNGYNDFKGVDVENKIILRLRGFPGHKDTNSLGYKKFHQDTRYWSYYLEREKDKYALKNGAVGIIEVLESDITKYWALEKDFEKVSQQEAPRSPIYEHKLVLPSDTLKEELLHIYPSKSVVNKIVETQNIDFDTFEKTVASKIKPQSAALKGVQINIDYKVETEIIKARNVLGVIEGENKDEIVVIGGHYDHLGAADGFVWNGADDNASGTIGVWMLAKAFKASGITPRKTIVFAAWTGEEKGLLGSEYFADHPFGDNINNIKFYVNFDMISKDSEDDTLKNQARMTYTSSLTDLEELTKKNIEKYNLNLDLSYRSSEKPRGGSDHSSFSAKDVPIMYFMAGFPITYHTQEDQTSDINWDKMVDIIKLSYLNLWNIVNEE